MGPLVRAGVEFRKIELMDRDTCDDVWALNFYDDRLALSDIGGWQIRWRNVTGVHVDTVGKRAVGSLGD